MRNFLGRLLVLIAGAINIILFFIIICTNIFDLVTQTAAYEVAYNGANSIVNIFDASLLLLFLIAFLWVNIWCIKNIVVARSMRHSLIGTFVLFGIELIYYFYHLFTPGVLVINLGLFIGIGIAYFLTTFALIVGCLANYFKDCSH